jgi:capsular exopolysaccharide synthesis family protein
VDDRVDNDILDLSSYLRLIWRKAWVVAAVAIVCAGALAVWSHSRRQLFESSAIVRVFDPSLGSTLNQNKIDPLREVDIETEYANTPEVEAAVRGKLGAVSEHVTSLTASGSQTTDAIQVHARASKKPYAKQAAGTFADEFVALRRAQVAAPLTTQADSLRAEAKTLQDQANAVQSQLDTLTPQVLFDAAGRPYIPPESEQAKSLRDQLTALSTRAASLTGQADQLSIDASNRQASLSVVTGASTADPVSGRAVRNGLIGFVLGSMLGIGFVLVRDRTRGAVDGVSDLPEELRAAATVVAVPALRSTRRGRSGPATLEDPASDFAEACRQLRAAVLFRGNTRPSKSILVTSASEGDGKTTIAANLAVVLAQAGRQVLLVDADLRRPNLHQLFGLDNAQGLTSSLSELPTPGSLVQEVLLPKAGVLRDAPQVDQPNRGGRLAVVTSGPPVADPGDLLVALTRGGRLASLGAPFDYVIVDSPPVLGAADALTLAWNLDGVVLVTRSRRTRRHDLGAAADMVLSGGRSILAVALNASRRSAVYPYETRALDHTRA